jgi:Rrf2 family transcriptional regulator, iron-sulfur cluster assembly transcription factor
MPIMFAYGQTAANAIAVLSYLAADPARRAGSREIAAARGISKVFAAKLLTQLAAAGFVHGQPGPGGGYTMAKTPSEISLLDIASIFEQIDPPTLCPFGHGWCGRGTPCPLHHAITGLLASNRGFLEKTSLSVFQPKEGRTAGSNKFLSLESNILTLL